MPSPSTTFSFQVSTLTDLNRVNKADLKAKTDSHKLGCSVLFEVTGPLLGDKRV